MCRKLVAGQARTQHDSRVAGLAIARHMQPAETTIERHRPRGYDGRQIRKRVIRQKVMRHGG